MKTLYQSNIPFPYIVIDNFLPEFLLRQCKNEIHNHNEWYYDTVEWTKEYQKNKLYYPNFDTQINDLKKNIPITNLIMEYLNSDEFLLFLTELTGIKNLFRDPTLMGGGIHRIKRGGKLSIHLDYNEHPETKRKRKLNLLVYLNENWESEWEGNLELWSKDPWKKQIEIQPIFNRAVIFDIENAPHGHPIPLNTPENIDRYSLALYYFVDEEVVPSKKHTVVFYKDEEVGLKNIENIFKI